MSFLIREDAYGMGTPRTNIMTTPTTTFFAHTDIVVIGSNPENADMVNPRGDIYGFAAYVVAEAQNGSRVRHLVKTARFEEDALPAAEQMAKALTARFASGRLPVAFDRWEDTYPAYGSPAHAEEEADWAGEDEYDRAERDAVAGAYARTW